MTAGTRRAMKVNHRILPSMEAKDALTAMLLPHRSLSKPWAQMPKHSSNAKS